MRDFLAALMVAFLTLFGMLLFGILGGMLALTLGTLRFIQLPTRRDYAHNLGTRILTFLLYLGTGSGLGFALGCEAIRRTGHGDPGDGVVGVLITLAGIGLGIVFGLMKATAPSKSVTVENHPGLSPTCEPET